MHLRVYISLILYAPDSVSGATLPFVENVGIHRKLFPSKGSEFMVKFGPKVFQSDYVLLIGVE